MRPALGPDATGVGWIYQYALIDRTGAHDLAQLRSLQDWFLKFELQALDGVAEVATIGGMVKQYQVVVDPLRLRGYGIPLTMVEQAIREGNQEVGGSVIEMAEAEYMVRATGYVKSIGDLERIPVMATEGRHAGAAARRRGSAARAGDAPRHRRTRRRGRGGRRRRRHAQRRQRARHHRARARRSSRSCAQACRKASRSSRPTTAPR